MEKYYVNIIMYNDRFDKFKQYDAEMDDMIGVSRMLITFKPNKGYYIVNINIDRVDVLI